MVDSDGVDTVLAEAVGSCTDLRATVVRPLRRFYGLALRLAPLTTLVDPQRWLTLVDARTDLGYLFRLQLAESDIIVLNKRDLDVDYDRYAAAEAELAWLNRSVALTAVRESFAAKDWAAEVLRVLADECRTAGHDIGHAKLALVTEDGLVKLSVTASDAEPHDRRHGGPSGRAPSGVPSTHPPHHRLTRRASPG